MMNYIWAGIMLVSIICAIFTGNSAELTSSIFDGGESAVMLAISLLGAICLWSGLMNIAERSGITNIIAKITRPAIMLIFPKLDPKSPAAGAITMNIAANMLGLGNAATPLGIEAMKKMQDENKTPDTLSNHMTTFIVLNTASVQILPTTIAAVRAEHGAATPMDFAPALFVASIVSMLAGVILVLILNKRKAKEEKQWRII